MAQGSKQLTALAKRVRAARSRAGFTQAQLAEATDVSNETISRLERGAYDPSLATAVALADALGMSVDHLVGRRASAGRREPSSRTVARLSQRAEQLPPAAQRALLRIAELIDTK